MLVIIFLRIFIFAKFMNILSNGFNNLGYQKDKTVDLKGGDIQRL